MPNGSSVVPPIGARLANSRRLSAPRRATKPCLSALARLRRAGRSGHGLAYRLGLSAEASSGQLTAVRFSGAHLRGALGARHMAESLGEAVVSTKLDRVAPHVRLFGGGERGRRNGHPEVGAGKRGEVARVRRRASAKGASATAQSSQGFERRVVDDPVGLETELFGAKLRDPEVDQGIDLDPFRVARIEIKAFVAVVAGSVGRVVGLARRAEGTPSWWVWSTRG